MTDEDRRWIVDSPALGTSLSVRPCAIPGQPAPAGPAASARPVGLTFSGGGFRATLAALGVVRLVADAGLLPDVRYVSSVSGGSVANGVLATAWPGLRARGFSPEAVDELVISPTIDRVSTRSLKFSLLKDIWRTAGPLTRTDLLARRFDDWFFDGLELTGLDAEVRWIVNAANLTTGVRFRFERDVLGDYVIGLSRTEGTGLSLGLAAAASAAVPGAFAPVVLKDIAFPCATQPPVLLDGGAYDNTGLQALDQDKYRDVFLISLNAGGLLRPGGYGRIPLVRELARANALLYRQSTGLRTSALIDQFRLGRDVGMDEELPRGARRGVLVALATDLGERGGRLKEWRDAFPERRTYAGRDLALVPTVFDKLDAGLCRALVHRGWWLIGAVLAQYWPDLLPPLDEINPPPL